VVLQCLEGGRDILRLPDFEREDFETERPARRLNLARLQYGSGKPTLTMIANG
jgi:hypothetical protein